MDFQYIVDPLRVIKFKKLHPNAIIPEYKTEGAAGMDLVSVGEGYIGPRDTALIKTGLAVEIPPGYEGQIRSRSGLALKYGIMVLNGVGTVDSDYRGEIGVILHNTGRDSYKVNKGDRIAQLVINKVCRFPIEVVEELNETARGSNGFGSSGK